MTFFSRRFIVSLLFAILVGNTAFAAQSHDDPFESFNRSIWSFNKVFDTAILKPLALVYKKALPWPVRKGFSNFFSNIRDVPTIANEVLQANFYDAYSDLWRLSLNTTVGILGFIDVATMAELPKHKQDFGLTLARWGYVSSSYFVIPILGPSTVRDLFGVPVDYMLSIYPWIHSKSWRYGLVIGNGIVERASLLELENVVHEAAFDEYAFTRDAYLQKRKHMISGEKESPDVLASHDTKPVVKDSIDQELDAEFNGLKMPNKELPGIVQLIDLHGKVIRVEKSTEVPKTDSKKSVGKKKA